MPTNWTTWNEMDKFLETYNLPTLNQELLENLNRQITTNEIETVIKSSQQTKVLDWMASQMNFPNIKEEATSILEVFQKIQEEKRRPSSFYEASIILIPKPDKDTAKKENYRPIFLINIDAKILNKILANQI